MARRALTRPGSSRLPGVERDAVGEAFDEFSGICRAAVKTKAIRWLHESPPTYDRAWVIEPDVVYTGRWAELFAF